MTQLTKSDRHSGGKDVSRRAMLKSSGGVVQRCVDDRRPPSGQSVTLSGSVTTARDLRVGKYS
jgi:hypothetical protein